MQTMQSTKVASVAVVGCGALGQFYAAQLIHAGHHLRLLSRRDTAALSTRGLVVHQTPVPHVKSSEQCSLLHIEPQRFEVSSDAEALAHGASVDWVLVALKTTALGEAKRLVAPFVGAQTRVAVLCNGLGVEDQFAEWFGAERIFGMLCFIGVNRDSDGTIWHKAFGHVSIGHFHDCVKERDGLVQLFEGAGIACEPSESLLEARWRKLGWNLPFNGLCLLYDCTTDGVVRDAERRQFAHELARESVILGNLDLTAHGQASRIEPEWAELQLTRTDTMGAYAPSTLLDARAGLALEIEALFLEPLRRAQQLGASAPALTRLVTELRAQGRA